MTEQESVLIQLLGEYLFGHPANVSLHICEADVLRLSVSQNILGVCWSALKGGGVKSDTVDSYKKIVVAGSVLQTRKTEAFLRFYRELEENGVNAVCVKGITLRSLYPEPDLRPSSDEDLILDSGERKLFSAVCEKSGFKIKTENENQLTVYDEKSGLVVETQNCFFLPGDRISEKMDGFFEKSRKRLCETEAQGVRIRTLCPTDNLLYLICHVLKHYIRSGFGIRQICDILLFCKAYQAEIDFDFVFAKLCEISAEGFAADIFRIGRTYFGLDGVLPDAFVSREVNFENLLTDAFSAGVFGKSTAARAHSAALTLSAVQGADTVHKSAAKRVFVRFDELKASYPALENKKYLYPYFSCKRLFGFFKKPKSLQTATESLKIADERLRQFDAYGLLALREKKREADEDVMTAIRKRLESGKTVDLTVTGSSMTPFLVSERDSVELNRIEREPSVGDVVLYRRDNGTYVLHRVVKKDKTGLYFAGDSKTFVEGPVEARQLIAVCSSFVRKGKRVSGKEPRWRAYVFLWRKFIRLRPTVCKFYEKMKK